MARRCLEPMRAAAVLAAMGGRGSHEKASSVSVNAEVRRGGPGTSNMPQTCRPAVASTTLVGPTLHFGK